MITMLHCIKTSLQTLLQLHSSLKQIRNSLLFDGEILIKIMKIHKIGSTYFYRQIILTTIWSQFTIKISLAIFLTFNRFNVK